METSWADIVILGTIILYGVIILMKLDVIDEKINRWKH